VVTSYISCILLKKIVKNIKKKKRLPIAQPAKGGIRNQKLKNETKVVCEKVFLSFLLRVQTTIFARFTKTEKEKQQTNEKQTKIKRCTTF